MYADDEDAMLIMAISCPLASDNHVQISFASHIIIRITLDVCICELTQFRDISGMKTFQDERESLFFFTIRHKSNTA